ncbi:MAG: hypothetical protein IIC28_13230 [Chloroflexi bacterium]|nr:hypothetical protein [Chloroflexota bacterium]
MKKAFVVIAVLIAVVASTSLGGVKTASAFNPQPDPPGMPDNVSNWWDTEMVSMFAAIGDSRDSSARDGNPRGQIIIESLPDPGNNPGLSRP